MKKYRTFHQGDINFTPLEAFDKSSADVSRTKKLRSTANRVLIQEGEITGHHHGIWAQVAMFRDDGLARDAADASPAIVTAQLFEDEALSRSLGLDGLAPVIGFLIAESDIVIRHASAEGRPTGEHGDIAFSAMPAECVSPSGGYLITGKREWTAGDERRVQD
jgi:hypothetical protein